MNEAERIQDNRNRNVLIDNIKGILIILVVLGHLLAIGNSLPGTVFHFIHYLIYIVHMPMFILISGMFSKGKYDFHKFVKGCLIPYITFDVLYTALCAVGGGGDKLDWLILISRNGYWYILCIGIMRLLFTYVKKPAVLLAVSVVGSFALIYVSDTVWRFLSLGRVLLLYPIFYLGTRIRFEKLEQIRKHRIIAVLIGIILIAAECALYYTGSIPSGTHNQPDSVPHLLLKYVYMFVFTTGVFCAMIAIFPKKPVPLITKCGKNSVMIYLLHFFIVKVIVYVANQIKMPANILTFLLFVLLSILISWVLSREFLLTVYNKYTQKIMAVLHLT